MSNRIYCDGCKKPVGDNRNANYWRCVLMGDVMIGSNGQIMDDTGLRDASGVPLRQVDLCTSCASKAQNG